MTLSLTEARAEFTAAGLPTAELNGERPGFSALCPCCRQEILVYEGAASLAHACTGGCTWQRIGDELHFRTAGSTPAGPAANGRELVLTAASAIRSKPVKWAWAGLVPLAKLTVVAGPAGLGKSTLAAMLAARVSRGTAHGDLMTRPAHVFVASAEDDPQDTIRPRLEAHGADLSRVHLMDLRRYDEAGEPVSGFLELPLDVPAIEDAVRRYEAKLVLLDPIVAYLSPDKSAYREQHVREALGPLRAMAEATGAAVACVMHLNKSEGSDPLRRIGNSGAFTALPRSVLIFGRDPDAAVVTLDSSVVTAGVPIEAGDMRVLAVAKSNLSPDAGSRQFRLEPCEIQTPEGAAHVVRLEEIGPSTVSAEDLLSDEEPDERSALGEAKAWLRDLLTDGPRPAKEVEAAAREAGHALKTVKRAKRALKVQSAKIGRDGRWYWLPPFEAKNLRRRQESEQGGQAGQGGQREQGEQLGQTPMYGQDGPLGPLGPLDAECAHRDKHRKHWTPHPVTGRLVCPICHPPPKREKPPS